MPYVANGSEFTVNTTTTGQQDGVSIAPLVGGAFVMVWQDQQAQQVRGQLYNADGTLRGSEFQISTTGDFGAPAVTPLGTNAWTGNWFAVTWQSAGGEIRGKTYDSSDGSVYTPEFTVNTVTTGSQTAPATARLSNGGFVVVWRSDDSQSGDVAGSAIKAQLFEDAETNRSGSEFLVNAGATAAVATSQDAAQDDQSAPSVTGLSNGKFVVVWQDRRGPISMEGDDTDGYAVKSQMFNNDGTAVGSETLVNTGTAGNQYRPKITALSDGGYVVVWADETGTTVKARMFDADGTARAAEFEVTTNPTGNAFDPDTAMLSVAALSGGGFIVTWTDNGTYATDRDISGNPVTTADTTTAIRGQIVSATGDKVGGVFLVNTTIDTDDQRPSVAVLSNGNIVVAWHSYDSANMVTTYDVRAQLYSYVAGNCYLAGSLVYTDRGDVPVERLRIGDRVLTIGGTCKPIRWIGVTTIPARLIATPEAKRACLPMIVRKGAIHENVPSHDLHIAPLHAMIANGRAIPLASLANDLSIVQDDRVRDLVYHNVELETVDTIFVNRLPVLSLWPRQSPRFRFDNCDDYFALYPDGAAHDRALTSPIPDPTVDELKDAAIYLYRRALANKDLERVPA